MRHVLEQWFTWLPTVLGGLVVNLQMLGIVMLIGLPLAYFVALAQRLPGCWRWPAIAFVEIGRGAPALLLLYFFYLAGPSFGLVLTSFTAAAIALTWNASAYAAEILRAGLQGVPRVQIEAARALGLKSWECFLQVTLRYTVRTSGPALISLAIQMLQVTTLTFAIAVPEVMAVTTEIGNASFEYMTAYVLIAVLFLLIVVPLTYVFRKIKIRRESL